MRFLSFSVGSARRFGVIATGGGVVDLTERFEGVHDLGAFIDRADHLDLAEIESAPADVPLDGLTFERPVPWPRRLLCIGVNYGGRAGEYADPTDGAFPSVFLRFPDSFTSHQQPLLRPPESEQLDYEGEIAIVIGTAGRRIAVDDARAHIFGLTLANEGTIRDWTRHGKFNVTQGKNFVGSGSIGPWIVTIDEFGSLGELELTTTVNGEVRQHDSTATMRYPFEYLVSYLSTFSNLEPGDVILTGTPTGAGARFDPPRWLRPGDVVEVSVPGIGTLTNTIADEPLTRTSSTFAEATRG